MDKTSQKNAAVGEGQSSPDYAVIVDRKTTEPCHVKLEIEVPAERVTNVFEQLLGQYCRSAAVPGFRRGKTPRVLIRRKFAKQLQEDVQKQLLREALQIACGQEDVTPETTPRVNDEENLLLTDGAPFTFTVDFDVAPSFDLPDYKDLEVSCESAVVDDNSVQEVIDGFLRSRATYQQVDRAAAEGDLLKLTYHGKLGDDDVEVPGTATFLLDAEETWLALREPEILPGTIAGLIGVEAGARRALDVTFPDDYAEEALAGQTVPYSFDIHEVHATEVPELTDDIAKEIGAQDSDEVRERVRQNLEQDRSRRYDQMVRERAIAALMDGLDFPVPPMLLARETYDTLSSLLRQQMQQGSTQEDLKNRQKELAAQASEMARERLRRFYVFSRIADAEDVKVEGQDLQGALEAISNLQGVSVKVAQRRLRESGRLTDVIMELRESKAIDLVVSKARVIETEAEPAEADSEQE